jgi:general L-amino acid transport system substrate-binding protein
MRSLVAWLTGAALGGLASLSAAPTANAGTLDQVKARGQLICGANPGLAGFGLPDDQGVYKGLDVDECRAIAAAIFNDPTKVKFLPINAKDRPTILASGEIDVLIRNTTWTLSRQTGGMFFTGINYYDGQGFMVRKKLGVDSALKLDGASVCVQQGTTTELNLADYFRANNMKLEAVVFATDDEATKAYDTGRCDAYTTDASGLYSERLKMSVPDDHIVLPEIISKEPLGPSVRKDDVQWFQIVQWTHYALITAEELGVTQANVDEKLKSDNPAIRRLLGVEGDFGAGLGLTNDWAYRIIKHIGNYGESFERNVGMGSPIKIRRGLNALWENGGLQYAPPIR